MDKGLAELKETLRTLKVGEEIDHELEKEIAKGRSQFVVLFQPEQMLTAQPEVHLYFSKRKNGSYQLKNYDVFIHKSVHVFPEKLNDCVLGNLIQQLSTIDWEGPSPYSQNREKLRAANQQIDLLCTTAEGQKWAQLITLRYLQDQRTVNHNSALDYDSVRQQYSYFFQVTAGDLMPLNRALELAVAKMELATPHLYQARLTTVDLSTGKKGYLVSRHEFATLKDAVDVFNAITPAHFDQSTLQALQLPWAAKFASIYDIVDNIPVVVKTVTFDKEKDNTSNTVRLHCDVNDSKISMWDLMKFTSMVVLEESPGKEDIIAARKQYVPRNMTRYPLKRQALTTGKANTTVKKPPGRKLR